MSKRILGLLLCVVSGAAFAGGTERPNVVMVIVDDLGRQDVGVYGSKYHQTPNIDALAENGMRFDNAYAAHPRCVPSRLGIMSGRYPASYGIPGFPDRSEGPHALPLSARSLGEALRDGGYRTGYVGKWHLGKDGGEPEFQGFDVSIMAGKPGAPPSYFLPYEEKKNGKVQKFVEYAGGERDEYLTDRLTDEAIGFLADDDARPFLLVLAHYAVHTPIEAPKDLVRDYRKRRNAMGLADDWRDDIQVDAGAETKTEQNHPVYAAMVDSVDRNVGRLVASLEERGLREDTVIILTSDHGGLSSRGVGNNRELATTNLPFRHGKGWLYDGGIRVPMIVNWPGGVEAGSVSDVRTTGTDHYATLLELAGLPAEPDVHRDSFSYGAALAGEHYERPPMFWHSSLGRPTRTGDSRSSAVIDGDWKLIQWYSLDNETIERRELFNLVDDPGERNDVYAANSARAAALERALDAWKQAVNARLGAFKAGGI